MAAMIYTQQTPRPTPATTIIHATSSHRNSIHGLAAPIRPYAFTATPSLNSSPSPSHARPASSHGGAARHSSYIPGNLPLNVPMNMAPLADVGHYPRRNSAASVPRSQSAYLPSLSPQPSFSLFPPPMDQTMGSSGNDNGSRKNGTNNSRQTPERYRRPSGTSHQSTLSTSSNSSAHGSVPSTVAKDDLFFRSSSMAREDVHLRRRSVHGLSASNYGAMVSLDELRRQSLTGPNLTIRPPAAHYRQVSAESVKSNQSSRSSSSASRTPPSSSNLSPNTSISSSSDSSSSSPKHDFVRKAASPTSPSPLLASPTDAPRRAAAPSPLSKPVTMHDDDSLVVPKKSVAIAAAAADTFSATAVNDASRTHDTACPDDSLAVRKLAALNEKSKAKTSRLRRAFSFGSAAEFRKAAAASETSPSGRPSSATIESKLLAAEASSSSSGDPDAEQERIAKKQEANGLGNSIYGRRFFASSTDNLSVSSTASSASVMIRKMGRGVKRSTRSLVGLFRPKTHESQAVVADASVSHVTVEADRRGLSGLGIDDADNSERSDSLDTQNSSRKSIVGSDQERADVLAAVRKGILKKRALSPSRDGPGLDLPNTRAYNDSPNSSAPSTPRDDGSGPTMMHRRNNSLAIGNEDYFVAALKLRQDSNSSTPRGSMRRCATFSPRIVFYETWPSQEYDRRGDIATCNRLTPMLAQQIKEELNSFKMEMEVHENSKIYTHFF